MKEVKIETLEKNGGRDYSPGSFCLSFSELPVVQDGMSFFRAVSCSTVRCCARGIIRRRSQQDYYASLFILQRWGRAASRCPTSC